MSWPSDLQWLGDCRQGWCGEPEPAGAAAAAAEAGLAPKALLDTAALAEPGAPIGLGG